MKPGHVFVVLLVAVLAVPLVALADDDPRCKGCNVVVVSIDTLRADHVGAYGYHRNTTPNIDRIAGESVVFEEAVSQAPRTTPSHFSLFTSLYPSQHRSEAFSDRFTMLAAALNRSGYRTVGFHGGSNIRGELGFSEGFDTYHEVQDRRRQFHEAAEFIDGTLSEEDRPVFLFYHTFRVHNPYLPPRRYSSRYEGFNASLRNLTVSRLLNISADVRADDPSPLNETRRTYERYTRWFVEQLEERPGMREHAVAEYDGGIRFADGFIANLTRLLRDHGLEDDTILIITSDHGEEFGEHGGWQHSTVHPEVRHVPLILRIPGVDHRRVGEPVELIDVAPTLVDVLGLDPGTFAQELEGRSLLATMDGAETRFTLTEDEGKVAFVNRLTDISYVRHRDDAAAYNLTSDPREQQPLRDPDIRQRLRGQLADVRQDLGGDADELPPTEPYIR